MSVTPHKDRKIYFIRPVGQTGPIKIGCSLRPERRIRDMMAWSPVDLEIVAMISGDHELEWNIHDCFASEFMRSEWFRGSPRLVEAVEKIARGIPVGEAIDLSAREANLRKLCRRKGPPRARDAYADQIYWARRRAESAFGPFHRPALPDDASAIMGRWFGIACFGPSRDPTSAELARLDEVIAEPDKHFVRADGGAEDAAA